MEIDPGLSMNINALWVPSAGSILNSESEEIINKSSPRRIFSRKLSLQDYRERKEKEVRQALFEEAQRTARNTKYAKQ
jgi:hypothetical protein